MIPSRRWIAWVVLAALFAGQVVAHARCDVCVRLGCHATGGSCCGPGREAAADAATCPLCRAAADGGNGTTDAAPCRCLWEPLDDQPLTDARAGGVTLDPVGAAAVLTSSAAVDATSIEASDPRSARPWDVRQRPPRILYGVWRN